jgi:hypothetical protein
MHVRIFALFAALAFGHNALAADEAAFDVAAARVAMAGQWSGKLEYLDYGANRWFGIPVSVRVENQGDGVTTIRKADFDDGPAVGNVRITSVELFDPAQSTVTAASFRKGRAVDLMIYRLSVGAVSRDVRNWTVIEEAQGQDDDRPAIIRLTTTRTGDAITTLKEVDFQDDDKSDWLTRNRTTLTRTGD